MSLLVSVFAISLLSSAAIEPQSVVKVRKDLSTYEYVLPNGLHVALTPNPKAPGVSINHWVKTGSIHEVEGRTGMAHLFEHMMFRPVKKGRPAFDALIQSFGGDSNAQTRMDSTVYQTSVSPEGFAVAIEAEADRFKNLRVTDELLNIEREAVRSEYQTKLDVDPMSDMNQIFFRAAFPGHPYKGWAIGDRKDLDKITAIDCNDFFKKNYVPNRTLLSIAGRFELSRAISLIQKNYRDWKRGAEFEVAPPFSIPDKTVSVSGNIESLNPQIIFGYRVPAMDSKNFATLYYLNSIVFGSQYSLMDRRFVIEKKIASAVGSMSLYYDPGVLRAIAILLGNVTRATAIDEFHKLPSDLENLDDTFLEAYFKSAETELAESLLKNHDLNDAIYQAWGRFQSISSIPRLVSGALRPTKSELINFSKRYLTSNNLVVVSSKGLK